MFRVLRMNELDLAGKRVLIREDLNVPVHNGVVTSDARIRASLPTIVAAQKANARVMVMSHLGRPEEGVPVEEFSLAPVAARLSELLGRRVRFEREWLGGVTCEPGEVVLLAVHPEFQKRGIATQLNEAALDAMKAVGAKLAIVETGGDDGHAPARRAYEKAGYTGLPIVRYFKDL